jgi:hypothetical protein
MEQFINIAFISDSLGDSLSTTSLVSYFFDGHKGNQSLEFIYFRYKNLREKEEERKCLIFWFSNSNCQVQQISPDSIDVSSTSISISF